MADLVILVGVVTMYSVDVYAGLPLWCAGYVYGEAAPAWIALDADLYWSGLVECGDLVIVEYEGGQRVELVALDAAPLDRYCVRTLTPRHRNGGPSPGYRRGECVPIVGDVPELHWSQPWIGARATVRLPAMHRRLVAAERKARWM